MQKDVLNLIKSIAILNSVLQHPLIYAKNRAPACIPDTDKKYSLLMATMEITPGIKGWFDGVTEETKAVRALLDNTIQLTQKEQPDIQALLDLIPSYEHFHFAGHGTSNMADPMSSCLIPQKVESRSDLLVQDRLTVRQLFVIDLQRGLLAFISVPRIKKSLRANRDEVFKIPSVQDLMTGAWREPRAPNHRLATGPSPSHCGTADKRSRLS